MNRRDFVRLSALGTGLALTPRALRSAETGSSSSGAARIARRVVVARHHPHITAFDPFSALSVGNGEFAFTADISGLQTFAAQCEKDFPLGTMAHWAWHTKPPGNDLREQELKLKMFDTHGRPVGYATSKTGQEPLFNWLRENPHGLNLGQLRFESGQENAGALTPADLSNCQQQLDLWTGVIESRFSIGGKSVHVQTCAHPTLDGVAVRVVSSALADGTLQVRLAFPYGAQTVASADWSSPEKHRTDFSLRDEHRADFARTLDDDRYSAALSLSNGAKLQQRAPHEFTLGSTGDTLEFVLVFSAKLLAAELPSFSATKNASVAHWENFWSNGGFVDFGGCTDTRAPELERRTILSLYQTAVHCAASLPSAETGLLHNTWYGKFHLEMHWWHSVHFAAWNRFTLFERSMSYYARILPAARDLARAQGYRGARWPKMTDATGRDSPSPIGPLLIWQQPHPIYYAELFYRERPTRATLEQWHEVITATADFMADYAFLDVAHSRYVLGPPLKTVPEHTEATQAFNPTFELAYWRFGLRVACAWRQRLGLAPDPHWQEVLAKLSPLPMEDGCYIMEEGLPDTFTKWNWEHPSNLGAFGMQPGDGVDPVTMRRTLHRVMETWKWDECWGWDFPMTAMCAARVGEPDIAVKALLIDSPKNLYHPNGHNYQRPGLAAYLPGNGGLLSTIAMMAQGWTDGPTKSAPGFPRDGRWSIRAENLREWL